MINTFTDTQIKRVNQVCNEDRQSRKGIREYIKKDLTKDINGPLSTIFNNSIQSITDWIDTPTEYKSQHILRYQLSLIPTEEIVSEMFIAIAGNQEPVAVQSIVHVLAVALEFDNHLEAVKTAGELIGVCVDTGLYDVIMPGNSGDYIMIQSCIELDLKTQQFIDKTQYPNPMICQPERWKNNHSGGYLTISDSVLLGRPENHHEKKQALDALNIIQNIEWELDPYILEFYEEPNKEPENREARDAHKLMASTSEAVYNEMLSQGNNFWFTWRYDTRGRMYSQGYYINLQSTGYKKALLNFSKRQLITGDI